MPLKLPPSHPLKWSYTLTTHPTDLTMASATLSLWSTFTPLFTCHLHFDPHSHLSFHVTIPQLFKHASLCSLQLFSWRRLSWPKRSELKLQLLRYHAQKPAHVPIGATRVLAYAAASSANWSSCLSLPHPPAPGPKSMPSPGLRIQNSRYHFFPGKFFLVYRENSNNNECEYLLRI